MTLVTARISLNDSLVNDGGISFAGFNLTTGIIAFTAAETVIMLAEPALPLHSSVTTALVSTVILLSGAWRRIQREYWGR